MQQKTYLPVTRATLPSKAGILFKIQTIKMSTSKYYVTIYFLKYKGMMIFRFTNRNFFFVILK